MEKRDVTIKLGGEEYTLVPSFKALADISSKVSDPMHLIMRFQTVGQPPTFPQMAKVFHLAMRASGYDLSEDEVRELLFDEGYAAFYEAFGEYVGLLTSGGRAMEEEGNRAQRRAGKSKSKTKASPKGGTQKRPAS